MMVSVDAGSDGGGGRLWAVSDSLKKEDRRPPITVSDTGMDHIQANRGCPSPHTATGCCLSEKRNQKKVKALS